MSGFDCDVVVIGAGLAGAAAACVLTKAGKSVIIAEARERVGGRAFTRSFADTEEQIEFGGAWITLWQERIRHYAELTGIQLRPRHPIAERRWHDGTKLRRDGPCAPSERDALERAMARIAADALRYKSGNMLDSCGGDIVEVSLNGYLDRIGASRGARLQVMAWWTVSGNGDPDLISASEFLSSCAYGGGRPEGMIEALQHSLAPGAGVLAQRMIRHSGASLRLNCPATKVSTNERGVTITASGQKLRAKSAAICLPLNALGHVSFDPPLSPHKTDAIRRGHGGCAIKVWIRARRVALGTLATGGEGGLSWMFAERALGDGSILIVGFGLDGDGCDPRKEADIASALGRFFPEAELLDWDWHDWVRDPFARGTWLAIPADAKGLADSRNWAPEGRLTFATSDFAPQAAGWFEGALASGEAAATALLEGSAL